MGLNRMNTKQLISKRDNLRKKKKEALRKLDEIAYYLFDVEQELQNRKKDDK